MTSQIDPTVPVAGNPTTASVRANFATAQTEISALQVQTVGAPFLPVAGGAMGGPMTLANDPYAPMHPVTLGYFQANGGGGGSGGGGGVPEAPADGTAYGRMNATWVQVLPLTGGTLSGGLHFGSTNASAANDLTRHIDLYGGTYGINVTASAVNYNAPSGASHSFLTSNTARLTISGTAATWTVPVTLPADPTTALQASTKQYVDTQTAARLADAPSDGHGYVRRNATWTYGTPQLGASNDSAVVESTTGADRTPTITGNVTPYNTTSDGLKLAAARLTTAASNTSNVDGASILVAGPTASSNPNSVAVNVGSNALGFRTSRFNASGTLTLAADPVNPLDAVTKEYADPSFNNSARNLLQNPVFTIAQRAAGPFTANGAMTVDRWQLFVNTDTLSISQLAMADGDRSQIGNEAALYALNAAITGASTAGAYSQVVQHIEGVRRLSNKTVTISFWARYTTGTPKLGVGMWQSFGAGGSPSANVFLSGQAVTLGGTWARYSVSFTVPSSSGKTLGTTANTDFTSLEFWFSDNGSFASRSGGIGVQSGTIQIWGVQLELGSQATPLDYGGSPADQLRQCQRYYAVINITGDDYTNLTGATVIYRTLKLPTTMRATPSLTYSGMQYYSTATSTAFTPAASGANSDWAGVRGTGLTNACGLAAGTIMASADL